MQHSCKNCGTVFNGRYCHNCGQKADVHDLTFAHIFHEAVHAFTHADKSFFILLKKMIIEPGKVAYEYIIEGKRQRYYNPFTFFLLITAINAFIESALLNLREKIFHDNNEYAKLFNVYNKLMLLVTVPVIAFALFALYHRNTRRRYSEYTVFAMMLLSFKTAIDVFLNAVNLLLVYFFQLYDGLDANIVYPAVLAGLIAHACYRFHQKLGDSSVTRSLAAGLLFFSMLAGIDMFIVWAFLRDFNGLGVFSIYGLRISG